MGIYLSAVLLRVGLYRTSQSSPAFFTAGDASHYRYALMVAQGKPIPVLDKEVQYPEGLRARERTAWFMEFFVGYLYRIMSFSNIPFDTYVRLFVPIFSGLSILALFLLAREVWGNSLAAIISSLFYAFSLPAVARDVGFAFLKEHFALPLIFFHLYFFLSSLKGGKRYRIVFSGFFLFMALGSWHLTQFYFGLLAIFILASLMWRKDITFILYQNFGVLVGFAFLGGLIIPYLRASFFVLSYPMLLSYSLLLAWALISYGNVGRRKAFSVSFLGFLGLILLTFFLSPHAGIYSHVYSLILYKIKFLGQKPVDPALLPFEARFYWFPDWTSPNLRYILTGFSILFLMGLLPLGKMVGRLIRRETNFAENFLLYFTLIFFILYLLLQRMEVFLSFFLAIFSGGIIFLGRKRLFKRLAISFILLVFLMEVGVTTNHGLVFDTYSLGQLIAWVRDNTGKDEVFLSSISPSLEILTYTGRPIAIHSFLESRDIREKIKGFAQALVAEGEGKLYSFSQKYGANYLVIPQGIYTDAGPYSTRYITDHLEFNARAIGYRLEVPGESEPFSFEYRRRAYRGWMEATSPAGDLEKFDMVFANKGYKVYKVYRAEEVEEAQKRYALGREYLRAKEYEEAIKELRKAISLYPKLAQAYYDLGIAYYGLGDEEGALTFLGKARRGEREKRQREEIQQE